MEPCIVLAILKVHNPDRLAVSSAFLSHFLLPKSSLCPRQSSITCTTALVYRMFCSIPYIRIVDVSNLIPRQQYQRKYPVRHINMLTRSVMVQESLKMVKQMIRMRSTKLQQLKKTQEQVPVDQQGQAFVILDNLNIKLDTDYTGSILLFGSGVIVTLWLASAIVGAIDSIPLFLKLMEVIGLAYTLWFSSCYLLFKKNRDELAAKIEELKQEVEFIR